MVDYKKIGKYLLLGGAVAGATLVTAKTFKLKNEIKKYNKQINCKSKIENYESDFETDSLAIVFSSVTIKFTDESLKENEGILEILGICSSIKIVVPEDWEVKLNGEKEKSVVKSCGVNNDEESTNEEVVEDVIEDVIENKKVLVINYKLKSAVLSVVSPSEYENEEECCSDGCCSEEEVIEEVIEE